MAINKSSWSNAQYVLFEEISGNDLLPYGDVAGFVDGLKYDEVVVVSEAIQVKGPDAPYFVTVLEQYRARRAAAGMVETALVDGHGDLAKTMKAVVEANRR